MAHARETTGWMDQLDLVRKARASELTDDEFQLFVYTANQKDLDPLQNQIYAQVREYRGKRTVSIQTGIDGYRLIAARTGRYRPGSVEFLYDDQGKFEAARVSVWVLVSDGSGEHVWHEYSRTAFYREYVQVFTKNGKQEPVQMWRKMPRNQTAKCAEALAIRAGFPEEIGILRTDDELAQADSDDIGDRETLPLPKDDEPVSVGVGAEKEREEAARKSKPRLPDELFENPPEGSTPPTDETRKRLNELLTLKREGKPALSTEQRAAAIAEVSKRKDDALWREVIKRLSKIVGEGA